MGGFKPDNDDQAPDRQAEELADKLRLLASFDPELARGLVAELVVALDRATAGAFGARLSPASRSALGLPPPADQPSVAGPSTHQSSATSPPPGAGRPATAAPTPAASGNGTTTIRS